MTDTLTKYYAFAKRSIKGPFYPVDISHLPGFCATTLVCPETALGQWREAGVEPVFKELLNQIVTPAKKEPALTHAAAEETAMRSLLEKAIEKNSLLENELREIKREYAAEKRKTEETLKRKETENRALADKIKRTQAAGAAQSEQPSWEHLYKNQKKNADEKIFGVTQSLSEKKEECLRLKTQIQNMVDTYENSKRNLLGKTTDEKKLLTERIKTLESDLEEKETTMQSMGENMQSVLRKNEEIQRIMLDEKKEYEEQNSKFCEEIGKLKGEVKWKQQEMDRLKLELFDTLNKMKEFESQNASKSREQAEGYQMIHSKIRLLSDYFENLESRIKFSFRINDCGNHL